MSEPKNCIHGVNTINFCLDCYKESRGVAPTKPQQDPMKKHVPGLGCKCEAYAAIECCCDGVDWRSSREVELEAELADLRQVAQGLRQEIIWHKTDKTLLQEQITKLEDEKKQIVNNSIKFLDNERCEKHFNEAKALSCAEYITAEKAAGCRMCLKQEIADLQTKLSVATKEVKVLTEIRANQAHLIKCLQSEVAELRGNVHDE